MLGRQLQYPNLKRKPEGPYVDIAPKRQIVETPRPIAIPRTIQPRPSSNGLNPAPSPTIIAAPPTGRKRGRPSKAEKAEKEAQLRAGGHFGVFPNRQSGPGNYHPISAAPAAASAAPLPPISTVSDTHSHPSPATVYNVVSESPDDTSARHDRGQQPVRKPQTDEKLQETRPLVSNTNRSPRLADLADTGSHKDSRAEGMFPSQPRQMPSPMEPRQLPSLVESIPSTGPAKRLPAPAEHPGSPMSQHHSNNKPGSHSPHLKPAPAAIVP